MKLVFISDTHGMHDQVKLPDGDVLIHCGDCTDDAGQLSLRDFAAWFGSRPFKHKIMIAGNHDWAFQKWPSLAQAMVRDNGITYLEDSGYEIDGVKFWGSPYQPEFFNWAFNLPRGEALKRHWDMIPRDTDVLITHGPPQGILDYNKQDDFNCGCEELLKALVEIQPKVHCFGHIHTGYGTCRTGFGMTERGWTTIINASSCNERYKIVNAPFIYDLAT
jgi:Icc-related predicted phosphoesterase